MKVGDMVVYQRGKGVDEYIASIIATPSKLQLIGLFSALKFMYTGIFISLIPRLPLSYWISEKF